MKNALRSLVFGLMLVGSTVSGWCYVIPVIDAASLANGLVDLAHFAEQINDMKETWDHLNKIYKGMSNWRESGWVDNLNFVNLPFFDGVEDIDDLRDIAKADSQSLSNLKSSFTDVERFKKMTKDGSKDPNVQEYLGLVEKSLVKRGQRKLAMIQLEQKMQKEGEEYQKQLKNIQSQIEDFSKSNNKNQTGLDALSARLQVIQAKINSNEALTKSMKIRLREVNMAEDMKEQDAIDAVKNRIGKKITDYYTKPSK
jgi:predicted ribosome quality control (RQC) complex YloA/Tae2 family protein